MRILHFADVHLDRPFVGLSRDAARQRRADLGDAFRRCLTAARTNEVDLVTIGGDLWEDENVTPDTRASVAHQLGELDLPVVLVAGNHDPYLRGGVYQRTRGRTTSASIDTPDAVPTEIASSVTLWAASWTEHRLTLDTHRLRAPNGHDSRSSCSCTAPLRSPLRRRQHPLPTRPRSVRRAGIDLVLAGHIHTGSTPTALSIPAPRTPQRDRDRTTLFRVDRHRKRRRDVELVDVNRRSYVPAMWTAPTRPRVPRSNRGSNKQLAGDAGPKSSLRSAWSVRRRPIARLTASSLPPSSTAFAAVSIEDRTIPAIDYSELARRHSADGLFVTSILEQIEQSADPEQQQILQMALQAGVRAMAGRKDVLSVD